MSQRCLVFGTSGYVGSAIRKALEEEGCRVVGTTLADPADGEIECELLEVESVQRAVQQAAEKLGGLDVLVMAAGLPGDPFYYKSVSSKDYDRLTPVDAASFDELMMANARGTFAACQAAGPHLKESDAANIVVLAAIDGIKPVPAPVHFAASQSALKGMVESLAKELGHFDVCANLVALGILEGGWAGNIGEELREAFLTHCSMKRLGKAEEVADLVAWLAVENTYLTGQTLVLDGGL